MVTPEEQVATQLRNIEEATGLTPTAVATMAREHGLEKHGQIVSHLKTEHGMTHGNANLLSALARELIAGGPAGDDELLAAQYAGAKQHLRPVHDELVAAARALGDDVEVVVQKTAVSLRRGRVLGVVRAASSTRVELGLNLPSTPTDERVRETTGMCSHRVDLHGVDDVDDDVAGWLRDAYDARG